MDHDKVQAIHMSFVIGRALLNSKVDYFTFSEKGVSFAGLNSFSFSVEKCSQLMVIERSFTVQEPVFHKNISQSLINYTKQMIKAHEYFIDYKYVCLTQKLAASHYFGCISLRLLLTRIVLPASRK